MIIWARKLQQSVFLKGSTCGGSESGESLKVSACTLLVIWSRKLQQSVFSGVGVLALLLGEVLKGGIST